METLDVGCEVKSGVNDNVKDLWLSNWNDEVAITEKQKAIKRTKFRRPGVQF
jgi:hypothetical protein